MKIQIWSDIMCPFCYIGKKNFEKALEQLPFKDEIAVEWKSFQLDPSLDTNGAVITTQQYLQDKHGYTDAQIEQMQERINEMGASVGINFAEGKPIAANTLKSHQLLHLSKKYGKQNELEEVLFKAHFEKILNLANNDVLINLGKEVGLETDEMILALSNEAYNYEVQQDILEAKNIGVNGVPFFVLNNKYALNGAQPIAYFMDALIQAYNETRSKLTAENLSCSINGCE